MRAIDLFSGCGGMSVGLEEAARRLGCRLDVPLAVDFDAAALAIYRLNFPDANARVADVATLFDGLLGGRLTASERRLTKDVGIVDFLVGGPPCQGHSDLNNHTRRQDPKNALYLRMARAAEVLRPAVVVIENVASVQWDRSGVVSTTSRALECAGYRVAGQVLDLRKVGVPQRRKRFVLLATRLQEVELERLLGELADGMPNHPDRTVRWAIGDLDSMRDDGTYDIASLASPRIPSALIVCSRRAFTTSRTPVDRCAISMGITATCRCTAACGGRCRLRPSPPGLGQWGKGAMCILDADGR